ncbi:ABC transporter ATP-binding protein, partial [Candidatus Entotheonella palauensis]
MARIELQHLRKIFGESIEAVKDLSLTIEEGEFLVLVGPSGCGKTTTLRMIAGFEEPTAGEILMDGRPVTDLDPGQRNLGMVFQNLALFPHKTVAQNIEFGPRMKKVDRAIRRKRVEEVAAMLQIVHLLDKLPSQCSGGEAQRVALARTLITEPAAFLLDEPLSNLDAKLRRETRAEIDRLHQELEKTFIYVTHDQEEAMTLADRIVVMRGGLIEQVGTPLDIYHEPVSYFVADFFGSPSMNLIQGAIEPRPHGVCFRAPSLTLELGPEFAHLKPAPMTLGIRPE